MMSSTTASAIASMPSAAPERSTSLSELTQATTKLLLRSTRRTVLARDFLCRSEIAYLSLFHIVVLNKRRFAVIRLNNCFHDSMKVDLDQHLRLLEKFLRSEQQFGECPSLRCRCMQLIAR